MSSSKPNEGSDEPNSSKKKVKLEIDLEENDIFLLTKMAERLGISIDDLVNLALQKYEENLRKHP